MNLINNRMIIGASLLMMTFSLSITNVQAQTCPKVPTCSELGYVASSCPSGTAALKCPFDQSKVFCAKDCEGYTLSSCPAHASCSQCWNGKYRKTGCLAGYDASGDSCVIHVCDDRYYLTSKNIANCGHYYECQSGSTMKYYCDRCATGYVEKKYAKKNCPPCTYGTDTGYAFVVESCKVRECYSNDLGNSYASWYHMDSNGNMIYSGSNSTDKMTLTSKNDPNCANSSSYMTCKSGDTTYYMCNACMTGYYEPYWETSAKYNNTGGKCIKETVSSSSYYDCPSANGWQSSSTPANAVTTESCMYSYNSSTRKYTYKYRPTACKDGYYLNKKTWKCTAND